MAKQKKKPDNPDPMAITQAEELVLSTLRYGREFYGLAICEAVKQASGGSRTIGLSRVYSVLKRLEEKGYVTSRWGDEAPSELTGARRRYYKITGAGSNALDIKEAYLKGLGTFEPVLRGAT
ncbi:transcriptional regulator PadR family protein [Thalassoporum mexicanum PCC 7367]|uniref:PadR family transcriptional regulator n=1 Tax=Thalassoporum mexicanum TaxID=3457544 RepID=UPI00029FF903|nr:PadR family transcriptional regulator [Pseudanabaena sp. PCC 7367]AFY68466.1 transcriptional regulator PadR family protein [Pseudanabaena sp. PCC 7367]